MKYLLETTENYRVDNEANAQEVINEAKADNHYILKKYNVQYKERKSKGEVIDAWYKVTLVKTFSDEKEPEGTTEVTYTNGSAF
jgi:putative IMPACT (imprinted ancient) family translation regulator